MTLTCPLQRCGVQEHPASRLSYAQQHPPRHSTRALARYHHPAPIPTAQQHCSCPSSSAQCPEPPPASSTTALLRSQHPVHLPSSMAGTCSPLSMAVLLPLLCPTPSHKLFCLSWSPLSWCVIQTGQSILSQRPAGMQLVTPGTALHSRSPCSQLCSKNPALCQGGQKIFSLQSLCSILGCLHGPIWKGWTLTAGLQTDSPLVAFSLLGV